MKRPPILLIIVIVVALLQSCTKFYLCDAKTPIAIYADRNATKLIYTVQPGEQVVVKGKGDPGELLYVQYHYYYGYTDASPLRYIRPVARKLFANPTAVPDTGSRR